MAVELPSTLRRDRPLSAATEAYVASVSSRRAERNRAVDERPAPAEKKSSAKREIKYYRGNLENVTNKVDVLSCDVPLFALTSTRDLRVYERDGASVKIKPTADGAATVFDKDLWIYCIGQLVAGKNRDEDALDRFIELDVQGYLRTTGRVAYRLGVERLKDSLRRLKGTIVETNVYTSKIRQEESFGLLDEYQYIESANGEITGLRVVLPDWVWRSIEKLEVLSIPPGYFDLRKALERRLFEIGRKHCGTKLKWSISLEILRDKAGSVHDLKGFKRQIKEIVAAHLRGTFPTFILTLDDKSNVLTFHQKKIKIKAKAIA